MNDFGRRPNFSEAEAEAAGFNVVRWDESRPLPQPVVRQLRAARPGLPDKVGDLRLLVMRKGAIDTSKIGIRLKSKPPY